MLNVIKAMEDFGLIIRGSLKLDRWVATPTKDKPNKKNGRYFYTGENCFFKNWATGQTGHWSEKKYIRQNQMQKAEYLKRTRERKKIENQQKALKVHRINQAFNQLSKKAIEHSYLRRKQVASANDFKIDEYGNLIIPLYSCNGDLVVAYQVIDNDGNKRFKSGSQLQGAFYPIKADTVKLEDMDLIVLCEGYATGASIYVALNEKFDAINFCVLCAFSATNIDAVYDAIVSKYGKKSIIHIKDQDKAGIKSKVSGFSVGYLPAQDANDIACQFGVNRLAMLIQANLLDLTMNSKGQIAWFNKKDSN